MTLSRFLQKWKPAVDPKAFDGFIADLMEMTKPPDDKLFLESIVSHRDMRPVVGVQFGKYRFQLSPEEARKLGQEFIAVAMAAELDSYLYQYFAGQANVPMETVGTMVAHFRKWREDNLQMNEQPARGVKQ